MIKETSETAYSGSERLVKAAENFQGMQSNITRGFARKLHMKSTDKSHLKHLLHQFQLPKGDRSPRDPPRGQVVSSLLSQAKDNANDELADELLSRIAKARWFVNFVTKIRAGLKHRVYPLSLTCARSLWILQFLLSNE